MDAEGLELLERIGEPGLRLAIRVSFDRPGLVRLAKACRLKLPGKRAQKGGEDTLIDELTAWFLNDATVRGSIMAALIEANQELISRFDGLSSSELAEHLLRLAPRDAGRALFALGADPRKRNRPHVEAILGYVSPAAAQKQVHDLRQQLAAAQEARARLEVGVAASIEALRREVADLRRHEEEEHRRILDAIQETAAGARPARSELAHGGPSAPDAASRGAPDRDRVGIFVDVQNMYYAARQLNARLDFAALMAAATRERRLIRALAYVVQNRDIDQSGFLAMLQQKNYEVRRKDLKIRSDGSSKGDWDMEMALDILRLAGSLDVVVLVTGDGDFTSLVNQIKTVGPKVEVYSFPGSTAKELIEAADRHVALDERFLIRMTHST